MHVRGDDEQPGNSIETQWHVDVSVVEHRSAVQEHLEDHYRKEWGTKRGYDGYLYYRGDYNLHGMEAKPGSDVEVQVGVVHHVEAPEKRHRMEHDVLKIYHEVQHHKAYHYRRPVGHAYVSEEAIPPAVCRFGHSGWQDWKNYPYQQEIKGDYAEVARPAQRLGVSSPAAGNGYLP